MTQPSGREKLLLRNVRTENKFGEKDYELEAGKEQVLLVGTLG